MSDDFYTPPKAELATLTNGANSNNITFYVVSPNKLFWLYWATLGMYPLYWYFKNWKNYQLQTGESIWPIARTIFSIFFTHQLFERIHQQLPDSDEKRAWNHSTEATILVTLFIIAYAADRASGKVLSESSAMIIGFVLLLPMFIYFQKAQHMINLACGDPEGIRNQNFTPANFIWIAIGTLLWFFVLSTIF